MGSERKQTIKIKLRQAISKDIREPFMATIDPIVKEVSKLWLVGPTFIQNLFIANLFEEDLLNQGALQAPLSFETIVRRAFADCVVRARSKVCIPFLS